MIVRETLESFICITQHDHATVSGQLAEHWNEQFFWENTHTEDVILAIYQHDRGWINLDETPGWDEHQNKPYSFLNYPQKQKLTHYKLGIDEVEAISPYAAILCSMHYTSFMHKSNETEDEFISYEQERLRRLKEQLQIHSSGKEALLKYHFHLLQLFDDISLYLCMNQPGVSKEEEYPFFRNGFKNTELFAFTKGRKIDAAWRNRGVVAVSPFPLMKEVEATLPYKEIQKQEISKQGFAKVYKNVPLQNYEVKVTS